MENTLSSTHPLKLSDSMQFLPLSLNYFTTLFRQNANNLCNDMQIIFVQQRFNAFLFPTVEELVFAPMKPIYLAFLVGLYV